MNKRNGAVKGVGVGGGCVLGAWPRFYPVPADSLFVAHTLFWALGLARPVDTRDPDTAPTPSRTPTALYAEEGGRCKAMEKNTKRWAYALVLEPPRTSQSVTSTLLVGSSWPTRATFLSRVRVRRVSLDQSKERVDGDGHI